MQTNSLRRGNGVKPSGRPVLISGIFSAARPGLEVGPSLNLLYRADPVHGVPMNDFWSVGALAGVQFCFKLRVRSGAVAKHDGSMVQMTSTHGQTLVQIAFLSMARLAGQVEEGSGADPKRRVRLMYKSWSSRLDYVAIAAQHPPPCPPWSPP